MAAVTETDQPGKSYLYAWSLTTADPTGAAISIPGKPDRCWQVSGTFGSGTINWQGSNDGTNWFSMHDGSNTTIAATGAAGGVLLENPLFIRPVMTGSTAAVVAASVLCGSSVRG